MSITNKPTPANMPTNAAHVALARVKHQVSTFDSTFGPLMDDVLDIYTHMQENTEDNHTAATLTLATIMLLPEGDTE